MALELGYEVGKGELDLVGLGQFIGEFDHFFRHIFARGIERDDLARIENARAPLLKTILIKQLPLRALFSSLKADHDFAVDNSDQVAVVGERRSINLFRCDGCARRLGRKRGNRLSESASHHFIHKSARPLTILTACAEELTSTVAYNNPSGTARTWMEAAFPKESFIVVS